MNAVSHDQAHAALWDAIKRLITDCDGTPNISAGAPGVSDIKIALAKLRADAAAEQSRSTLALLESVEPWIRPSVDSPDERAKVHAKVVSTIGLLERQVAMPFKVSDQIIATGEVPPTLRRYGCTATTPADAAAWLRANPLLDHDVLPPLNERLHTARQVAKETMSLGELRDDQIALSDGTPRPRAEASSTTSIVAGAQQNDIAAVEYGRVDAAITMAGLSLTDGDRRLTSLLAMGLGVDHPAMNDLVSLLFDARGRRSPNLQVDADGTRGPASSDAPSNAAADGMPGHTKRVSADMVSRALQSCPADLSPQDRWRRIADELNIVLSPDRKSVV